MKPNLAIGIPEMDIPSVEPVELGDLIVSQRTKARNGLQISAKNIKVYNASQFNVYDMK